MNNTGIISLVIIIVNFIVSYKGLKDRAFFDRYSFVVERILLFREYWRLITSGFLHVSWQHLIFNMISLLMFSFLLEADLGSWQFLLLYFGSLLGGDLLSLFIHRHNGDYSSVGASGAICGVIFASIALFPGMGVSLLGLIPVPGWLYGVVFLLYSIYGIKSRNHNIGHDAHLGGALAGMTIAIVMEPQAMFANFATIIAIAVPAVFFMYVIITKPHVLLVDNFFYKQHHVFGDIDQKYVFDRANRQKELDAILEKIHKKGMHSLTKAEKEKLERYSQHF
ncbi:rhomboid family intramembrane serine protease [Chitinophaga sp. 22321]|uniref:Rhomboid family intramembrane serine protease n=1 Tax=Chitinophaga hostae TaxID=2831022 RepID=A0ABS5IXS1_9BACT|nr:rhomboid family intramembrane serine protease [Chitinophaga hostae]MBS0027768.1 rhomboid family intramembrane serine protease [Chitinophaga hostae]